MKSLYAVVSVKWLFEGYDIKQITEKVANEIFDEFIDINDYLVLININIKFQNVRRQENKGVSIYRALLSRLSSGGDESILLYSFFSKDDLGKKNIFIKILPDAQFKRIPIDFNNLIGIK